ncbi:hypothetical protein HYU23_03760 [Candidatus Woesearchaeota archaeon]|nr:hypothetical protein [Candidatus Woesearchaeota archaeon]
MVELSIPSLDELCPLSDLDDGIDEEFDFDYGEGKYLAVCRRELLPIAILSNGFYIEHDLCSPIEAQRKYEVDSRVTVLPVAEWYRTSPN